MNALQVETYILCIHDIVFFLSPKGRVFEIALKSHALFT